MEDVPINVATDSHRFVDRLRLFIRSRNLAYATEKTYVSWILQFIRFHKMKHPKEIILVKFISLMQVNYPTIIKPTRLDDIILMNLFLESL